MGDTMSELNILDQKIEYFLNSFHKIKDENDDLVDKLTYIDKELLSRNEKIDYLTKKLQEKEFELQELVIKLDKILD